MRFFNAVIAASFVFATASCGGGEEGEEAYATFADCYVDHAVAEALPPDEAIVICCLEHPIGDDGANVVCGESAQECVDFVDIEVSETDDPELTIEEIEAGCDGYLAEH